MIPSEKRRVKPDWLKKKLPLGGGIVRTERQIGRHRLNTVCHGAKCPNRNECYSQGTATFLILGTRCTRSCRFCSIPSGPTASPDPGEADRLAAAVKSMGLSYAVITSVTRDDLEDGGASLFAVVIEELRRVAPGTRVEVLIPDFQGKKESLKKVLKARPAVVNHNLETVPSLYKRVRPQADYGRSLELLHRVATLSGIPAKSGLMVGLGETPVEVASTLGDLKEAGVELVTIGQYLQPAPDCLEVAEFVPPERFESYARLARGLGFKGVASGPFVRSSHQAGALYDRYSEKRGKP